MNPIQKKIVFILSLAAIPFFLSSCMAGHTGHGMMNNASSAAPHSHNQQNAETITPYNEGNTHNHSH